MGEAMTAMERVMTALQHGEPDRVPYFLLATMHGARELGMTIPDYLTDTQAVIEGQLRMRERWGHDCLAAFLYGAADAEAFGAEVLFREDGPPNSGAPVITSAGDIARLQVPDVAERACLQRVLEVIRGLASAAEGAVPVFGVVISPFSLPVMQMGFEAYLDLLFEGGRSFEQLMEINTEFCVAWANAQLAAGATAIVYFDPVSSPTIVPRDLYSRTGFEVARSTLGRLDGATATHLASGRCLAVVDDLARTGTLGVGVSSLEDLGDVKRACAGRLAVIGNLDGVSMRRWSAEWAEREVRQAIAAAGPGGGFVLADNHGEIPWQVPSRTLDVIAAAVREWGQYPLQWVSADG
jgi:uroporphyrinogen decarboxylase